MLDSSRDPPDWHRRIYLTRQNISNVGGDPHDRFHLTQQNHFIDGRGHTLGFAQRRKLSD